MKQAIISLLIVAAMAIAATQAATVKRQTQKSGKKTERILISISIFIYFIIQFKMPIVWPSAHILQIHQPLSAYR
jgi:hypothetical protein